MLFSSCVELIVQQVAVKSLLVYASDDCGEAMEKKIKVSASIQPVCTSYAKCYHFAEDTA